MSVEQDIIDLRTDVDQLLAEQLLPADLLDKVSALLGRRDVTQFEFENWAAGDATGGPNGDGLYPFTDSNGFVRYVPSPSRMAQLVQDTYNYDDFLPDINNAVRSTDITDLIANTMKRNITFAVGDYFLDRNGLNNWCVRIADKKDLTVDAGGSRFVSHLDIPTAEASLVSAFQIEGCTNFTLKGAIFDYDVSPSGVGIVTDIALDRSSMNLMCAEEPPHFDNFDRYITQDSKTKITEVTEYAARDTDYNPTINYTILPLDGQAVGQPGHYQVVIPLIQANLASATVTDNQLTFTTQTDHGLPDGARISFENAQGLMVNGVSIVNGVSNLTATVTGFRTFVVGYDEDEPISIVGATPYVPNTGLVRMQRIPVQTAVGDRVIVWHRKHLEGPIDVFACKNLTLGTEGAPLVFNEAAAVIVKGRDIDGLHFNIYSRRNAAGGLILRDVRGIVTGSITAEYSGDDLIQFATGFWMNNLVGAVPTGQNYLDIKFATLRTQQPQLTLPRVGDFVNFAEPTYNNLMKTLQVTGMTARDAVGTWRIFFDGILPTGLTKDWFVHNASCKPKFRLSKIHCRGGGRLFLPKTDDCIVDLIIAEGMNNTVVLSRDPSSPQHPNSGGAAGGFRCRKLIALGCQWEFGNKNPAVLSMRRNGLGNLNTNMASDYWYSFDDVELDGFGYGGVAISGFNAVFGRLRMRNGGQLRNTIPVAIMNPQARSDLFAEWGVLQVNDFDKGAPPVFYEGPGGFVFFPNGSGLRTPPATLAVNATAMTAAKKVQVGHEDRIKVIIGGVEQHPSTYVANGTTTVTLVAPAITEGLPISYTIEHVRC